MYFELKFNDFNQYITRPRLEFRTWALNKNHDNELKKKLILFEIITVPSLSFASN
jgi:hypothetical protein